jgi:hypothetical protein
VYFTVGGIPAGVSITASGAVAKTLPFEGVSTGQVYQVNTGDIAALGGTKTVTLTAKEEGKEAVTISVTVNVALPAGTTTVEVSSITDMAAELAGKPANTPDTPYYVTLDDSVNFAGMGGTVRDYWNADQTDAIVGLLQAASSRYIVLDLSGIAKDGGSTTIPERTAYLSDTGFAALDYVVQLILPDWVTEIGNGAFRKMSKLKTVQWPASLTKIDSNAFIGAGFTTLALPASLTTLGGAVFENCAQLKSVDFAACTLLTELGQSMFKGCTELDTIINWPPNLKRTNTAFQNTGFVTIDIPKQVEQIAFPACSKLVWVRWPESDSASPTWSVSGAPYFAKIELPAGATLESLSGVLTYTAFTTMVLHSTTPPDVGFNSFYITGSNNTILSLVKVYVPDGYGDTYKNTGNWKNYWTSKVFEIQNLSAANRPENWTTPDE